MKLVIINYGSGNLHSVNKAFEVANKNLKKPYDIQVTDDPEAVKLADKIVLRIYGSVISIYNCDFTYMLFYCQRYQNITCLKC